MVWAKITSAIENLLNDNDGYKTLDVLNEKRLRSHFGLLEQEDVSIEEFW